MYARKLDGRSFVGDEYFVNFNVVNRIKEV